MSNLADWWREQTDQEIRATVPKAIEYGSRDLIALGQECAEILGREGVSDAEAIEIGVWFYTRGKFARWTAALRRGEQVSDDTIFDIGVYVKMLQRTRLVGSWPGDSDVLDDQPNPLLDDPGGIEHQDTEALEHEPPFNMENTPTGPVVNIGQPLKKTQYAGPGRRVVNIEVSGPPGEAEVAGAETRVQAMREIHEFRSRLKKRGFQEFNAVGELRNEEYGLVVSTQYESMGDWRVKIWHNRVLTINEFIPRDRARQTLEHLELITWKAS